MKFKKILFVLMAAFCHFQFIFATPVITVVTLAPASVGIYNEIELTFNLNTYSNPYDPAVVNVFCEFWSPTNVYYKVNAFYYEGHTQSDYPLYTCVPMDPSILRETVDSSGPNNWKVRFTPNQTGNWSYRITAIDASGTATVPSGLTTKKLNFSCTSSSNPGFIVKANNRFLKRTTGEFFFPVGPNVAWYNRCGSHVYGTNEYEYFINRLSGNSNYMRVWLDCYDGNALVGYDSESSTVFFDLYNQKDAWRLDKIFAMAKVANINIQLCFFTHGSWGGMRHEDGNGNSWIDDQWASNAFNIARGGPLANPYLFFDVNNTLVKSKTKNLIRYIVARWGYATNLMAWELWNEYSQIEKIYPTQDNPTTPPSGYHQWVVSWHDTMSTYIRSIDPHHHLITSSYGGLLSEIEIAGQEHKAEGKNNDVFHLMDFCQDHEYNDAVNGVNFEHHYYELAVHAHSANLNLLDKPYFIGECGYGDANVMLQSDPHGLELHNFLWSSCFSTSLGASSFYFWDFLQTLNLWPRFLPMTRFMNSLSTPSDDFTSQEIFTPNGLRVYSMHNNNNQFIYGWAQDFNFTFGFLNQENNINGHLYLETLDNQYKPSPFSINNSFTIPVQAHQREYIVEWYSAETGLVYSTTTAVSTSNGFIELIIPMALRTSTFGDAVFKVYLDCSKPIWRDGPLSLNPQINVAGNVICNKISGQVFYKTMDGKINSYWWNPSTLTWDWSPLNNTTNANTVAGDLVMAADNGAVFYRTNTNKINCIYWNSAINNWSWSDMNNAATNVVGPLAVNANNQVFYCSGENKIRSVKLNTNTHIWNYDNLNNACPANVGNSIAIGNNLEVFYKTVDGKINSIYYNNGLWYPSVLNNTAIGVTSNISVNSVNQVFFTTIDNKMHQIYWNPGINAWQGGGALNVLGGNVPNVGGDINVDNVGEVFYRTLDNKINSLYYETGNWHHSYLNDTPIAIDVVPGWISPTNQKSIYYRAADNTVRRIYYRNQCDYTPSTGFDKHLEVDNPEVELNASNQDFNTPINQFENTRLGSSDDVLLFPNPAYYKIIISSREMIQSYSIYTMNGTVVLQKSDIMQASPEVIVEQLLNGMYLAEISLINGQVVTKKFVVQH